MSAIVMTTWGVAPTGGRTTESDVKPNLNDHEDGNRNNVSYIGTNHSIDNPSSFSHLYDFNNEDNFFKRKKNSIDSFKERIGARESGNNYKAINTYGYLGRYQFSTKTLKGLGFSFKNESVFINSKSAQERAMDSLMVHNARILDRYGLGKYVGTSKNGVKITVYGMLAGAHLVGPYAVKKFVKSGIVSKDAYGTSVADYMELFD